VSLGRDNERELSLHVIPDEDKLVGFLLSVRVVWSRGLVEDEGYGDADPSIRVGCSRARRLLLSRKLSTLAEALHDARDDCFQPNPAGKLRPGRQPDQSANQRAGRCIATLQSALD
jgi:hypothetical protein